MSRFPDRSPLWETARSVDGLAGSSPSVFDGSEVAAAAGSSDSGSIASPAPKIVGEPVSLSDA
ncbi:MAG: hypothetical protein ABEN55_13170, partial [Bradymonadaceae bacterium]